MNEHLITHVTPIDLIELNNVSPNEFIVFYNNEKNNIIERLFQKGVLKFIGVQIDTMDDFQCIMNAISDKFMSYIDGNSPRTKLSNNIYTSTEYDSTQKITMHNELSYSANWPNILFLSCLKTAISGGETLIADSRRILKEMNSNIVEEIENKGIMYIRNLHGGKGIGPSWQDTFETTDRQQLEAYCKAYSIGIEWKNDNDITLKQFRKGIIKHRITGEKVWFNQIDQFHPIQLGEEMYETLSMIYASPEEYPTYVTFGDGSNISEFFVKEIMRTIEKVTYAPIWQKNEILMVDNELTAHGRNPYTGDRRVVLSMAK